jgi:hypothetical protein
MIYFDRNILFAIMIYPNVSDRHQRRAIKKRLPMIITVTDDYVIACLRNQTFIINKMFNHINRIILHNK